MAIKSASFAVGLASVMLLATVSGCDGNKASTSSEAKHQQPQSQGAKAQQLTNSEGDIQPTLPANTDTNTPPSPVKAQSSSSSNVTSQPTPSINLEPLNIASQLKRPVNDFVGVLTQAQVDGLENKLKTIDSKGLLQIGVVIVPTTNGMPIFDYALTIARKWGLGSQKNSNGVFVLLAVNDQQMYILTGSDVEDVLTNERVSKIIENDITPYFRQDKYADGLSSGVDALVRDFEGYRNK